MPSVSQLVPPFPAGLPTASLVTLDFDLLQKNDPKETERLFISCCDQGFFYLKNHRVPIADAFQFGRHLFNLPLEEKEKYAMGDGGNYMGYKHVGGFIVDSKGTPDSNETWNFSKDDVFGISENPRAQPAIVQQNMHIIRNHIDSCRQITSTLLTILSDKLNLTGPSLPSLHEIERPAGNQFRVIKSWPMPESAPALSAGAHTDFGSLTVLFNNIGGLQVYFNDKWEWVPPKEGCAIINLGDAMVRFTDGLFKSATHRVAKPPGEQNACERWSVVYFERPNDDVRMEPLIGDNRGSAESYPTTKEWIERRVLGGKISHYKGEQEYLKGRGTEAGLALENK